VDDFNPYAAPEVGLSQSQFASPAEEGRGVWQDGKILVMAKVARLPYRCVRCNEPATNLLKRTLSWHTPWIYVLLAVSPLIYIIVALIIRKTAKIEVPLCDEHRAKRSRGLLIALGISLTGIALCFTPAFLGQDWVGLLVLTGVVTILGGLIFGLIASQTVVPQKIDETHVWLKKISPVYLAELPSLPDFDGR
jgi:hypothetical protein